MIVEIKFLGILVVLDPKTVEALIQFAAGLIGRPVRSVESASSTEILDS